jgi:hypothetical protein|eukprot:SAG25_NODE_366_length_9120_cov_2.274138_10_plen_55_part_00
MQVGKYARKQIANNAQLEVVSFARGNSKAQPIPRLPGDSCHPCRSLIHCPLIYI